MRGRLGKALSASLVTVMLASISLVSAQASAAFQTTIKLVEQAPKEVFSYQPVLIFAQVEGVPEEPELEAVLDISVNISYSPPLSSPPIVLPDPPPVKLQVPMVPVPWSKDWYIAAIPPSPRENFTFSCSYDPPGPPPPFFVDALFQVSSRVSYNVTANGIKKAGGYTVLKGTMSQEIGPTIYASPDAVTQDTSIIEETFGLGPRGWVHGDNETMKAVAVAWDDEGIQGAGNISFEYQVGETGWAKAAVVEHAIMAIIQQKVSQLNDALSDIETAVKQLKPDFQMKDVVLPFVVVNATIPAQSAGTYVRFRAKVTDTDDNTSTSPVGFYQVTDDESSVKVLIVDPHVKIRVLQEGAVELTETVARNSDYGVPAEIAANLETANRIGRIALQYGLEPFHHWEYLGKQYDLYIAYPSENLSSLLRTRSEGGISPNVIVLSNLSFGEDIGMFNWDLARLGVLGDLVRYIKNNHAGLVATHGTLSDWKLWASTGEQYEIGARGHIGDHLADLDPVNERTITAMLGMPHLSIYEYVRDQAASALCSNQYTYSAGLAVGSLPLQIPYVPFSGSMNVTAEGRVSPVLEGIPDVFAIEIPLAEELQQKGIKSLTQVGWQLGMPQSLANMAWKAAKEVKAKVKETYSRLEQFIREATQGQVSQNSSEEVLNGVEWGTESLYNAIGSANISGNRFKFVLSTPEGSITHEVSIDYEKLLQLMPVRVVSMSSDGLAGIITYDKYFDPNGYRAVYFSPEIEASYGENSAKILVNAVEWTRQWALSDVTELVGGVVRVSKEQAARFREEANKVAGDFLFAGGLLLNESGKTITQVSVTKPSLVQMIVAHPTSDNVSIAVIGGPAQVQHQAAISGRITRVTVAVLQAGTVDLGLAAFSDLSMNPVYIEAKVIALLGDANGDGRVNALDITKVERVIARLDPSTTGADANGDSAIDAIDITTVERIIAGLN